jgi:hypothetical protein
VIKHKKHEPTRHCIWFQRDSRLLITCERRKIDVGSWPLHHVRTSIFRRWLVTSSSHANVDFSTLARDQWITCQRQFFDTGSWPIGPYTKVNIKYSLLFIYWRILNIRFYLFTDEYIYFQIISRTAVNTFSPIQYPPNFHPDFSSNIAKTSGPHGSWEHMIGHIGRW